MITVDPAKVRDGVDKLIPWAEVVAKMIPGEIDDDALKVLHFLVDAPGLMEFVIAKINSLDPPAPTPPPAPAGK